MDASRYFSAKAIPQEASEVQQFAQFFKTRTADNGRNSLLPVIQPATNLLNHLFEQPRFYGKHDQVSPLHRFPVVERRADSRIISFDLIECLLRMCRNSEVRSRHEASGRDAFGNCAAHISASDNCDFHAVVKFKFQR